MVGLLPYNFVMGKSPQGHGYTVLEVDPGEPLLQPGTRLKGP